MARLTRPRALVARSMLVGLAVLSLLLVPLVTAGQAPGAATPQPAASAPAVIGSGDSRSEGEGPGLVGSPVAIAIGVVFLGVVTALGTLAAARIGGSRRDR
jgi:hypothetical protein